MNAKKCKALRKFARTITVGLPAVAYRTTTRGKVYQYGTDPLTGLPLYAQKNDTLALDACTRAVYQGKKREAARA